MFTLQDFLEKCKTISADEVYDTFEAMFDNAAYGDRREVVYDEAERLGLVFNDPNQPLCEPTRQSMETIGLHYKIQSLIDY